MPHDCHTTTSSSDRDVPHRLAILCLLGALTGVSGSRIAWGWWIAPAPTAMCQGVDPNVAPWWELTLLPEIGPATAKAIIIAREEQDRPPFRTAFDLTRVRGIGPRTVERLRQHLRFDTGTTEDDRPLVPPEDSRQ